MSDPWTIDQIPDQAGRIAIVTGASSGLGLETAIALATANATVILACRNPAKADDALAVLRSRVPSADARLMRLDLADLASVKAFAKAFSGAHQRLDLLINNAGVMAVPLSRTRDGFEMQIGTNHLGHFALTGLLIEHMLATENSRIVNLASLAHKWTRAMNLDDLNFEQGGYNKWDAYGKSKLANLLFTFELKRRLDRAKAQTIVSAAHPGYASTNLQFVGPQQAGSRISAAMMKMGNLLFSQSSTMGALPTLYAATAPDVHSGDYFGPDGFMQMRGSPRRVGCRGDARDEKSASRLWSISQELTGQIYL